MDSMWIYVVGPLMGGALAGFAQVVNKMSLANHEKNVSILDQ
jgi:hypothetical protein